MAEEGKYYWLKLKRDFFKRHDIRIIEEMPNGKGSCLWASEIEDFPIAVTKVRIGE